MHLFLCGLGVFLALSLVSPHVYAQLTDSIPSIKEQLNAGVLSHDVICKQDLLLVQRSPDKVACISFDMASVMDWKIIEEKQRTVSNIKNNIAHTMHSVNRHDAKIIPYVSSVDKSMFIYYGQTPPYYHSLTFPEFVSVNETFTVEYTWTRNEFGRETQYNPAALSIEYGNNVTITVPPWVEFVDIGNHKMSTICSNAIDGKFNSPTDDTYTANFTLRYVKLPSDELLARSFGVYFADGGFKKVFGQPYSDMNKNVPSGSIYLSYNRHYEYDPKNYVPYHGCQFITPPPIASNAPPIVNNVTDDRPDCITKYKWRWLEYEEKDAIISNSTTCTVENGTTITNVPYNWQRMSKPPFDVFAKTIDNAREAGVLDIYEDVEEAINSQGIYEDWVDDFIEYYEGLSKQSSDFFFDEIIPKAYSTSLFSAIEGNITLRTMTDDEFIPVDATVCVMARDAVGNVFDVSGSLHSNRHACTTVPEDGFVQISSYNFEHDHELFFRIFGSNNIAIFQDVAGNSYWDSIESVTYDSSMWRQELEQPDWTLQSKTG